MQAPEVSWTRGQRRANKQERSVGAPAILPLLSLDNPRDSSSKKERLGRTDGRRRTGGSIERHWLLPWPGLGCGGASVRRRDAWPRANRRFDSETLADHPRKSEDDRRSSRVREWWPGSDSNQRHADFQSAALPTELPGQRERLVWTSLLKGRALSWSGLASVKESAALSNGRATLGISPPRTPSWRPHPQPNQGNA